MYMLGDRQCTTILTGSIMTLLCYNRTPSIREDVLHCGINITWCSLLLPAPCPHIPCVELKITKYSVKQHAFAHELVANESATQQQRLICPQGMFSYSPSCPPALVTTGPPGKYDPQTRAPSHRTVTGPCTSALVRCGPHGILLPINSLSFFLSPSLPPSLPPSSSGQDPR
jgi:hypothetical protein